MIEQPYVYAAAAAFVAALIALAVYHAAVLAPALARQRAILASHDDLLGGPGKTATGRLEALDEATAALRQDGQGFERRLAELERLARTDVSRIGFVRYDAFADAGSGLSYSLALLNREGDGVVITSIYSRSDSRTYGKGVEKFAPVANASAEELAAIAHARESEGGKH